MSASGRTCRKVDRAAKPPSDELDVELAGPTVVLRSRGRIIRTLTGAQAETVRAAIDDPNRLQRALARWSSR